MRVSNERRGRAPDTTEFACGATAGAIATSAMTVSMRVMFGACRASCAFHCRVVCLSMRTAEELDRTPREDITRAALAAVANVVDGAATGARSSALSSRARMSRAAASRVGVRTVGSATSNLARAAMRTMATGRGRAKFARARGSISMPRGARASPEPPRRGLAKFRKRGIFSRNNNKRRLQVSLGRNRP